MKNEEVIWDAEFNPAVKQYWLLTGGIVLLATVIGIVLIPFWFLFGSIVTGRYLKSHRCTLTNRNLKVAKGVLTRTEKTVPLDRITDVGLTQGPIMRMMGIEVLTVETAGQSSAGALVGLAGIKQGREFRDAVLKQRDLAAGTYGSDDDRAAPDQGASNDHAALLETISNTLLRIEKQLNRDAP
tara:strand:- start:252458 stop:253009 length:552 start_codon:yes stop_codon:yes gene_type:complete